MIGSDSPEYQITFSRWGMVLFYKFIQEIKEANTNGINIPSSDELFCMIVIACFFWYLSYIRKDCWQWGTDGEWISWAYELMLVSLACFYSTLKWMVSLQKILERGWLILPSRYLETDLIWKLMVMHSIADTLDGGYWDVRPGSERGNLQYSKGAFHHQNFWNNFFQCRFILMLNTDSWTPGNVFKKLQHCSIIVGCWDIHWSVHLLFKQVCISVDIYTYNKSAC